MHVKALYDEDNTLLALCRTRAELDAAFDVYATPGARLTVRDEERSDVPMGDTFCSSCFEEFTADIPCCCDSGTNIDGSHDEGYCQACCPNSHASYPWPTYERTGCDA